jgi:hypothetical protein
MSNELLRLAVQDALTVAWKIDVILEPDETADFSEREHLHPGGVFVIQEAIRPVSPKQAGQAGALLDLYFALTSQAGTWSYEEMADWQRQAGLEPERPIRFQTVPGIGQQAAVKPRTA